MSRFERRSKAQPVLTLTLGLAQENYATMSTAECCQPTCCPTVQTVDIPGSSGADGAAGADGANGVNAFTVTTNDFVVPPDLVTPVTVAVASSLWMVIGQPLIIGQGIGAALANPGPASFKVNAIPSTTSVTLLWTNRVGDVAAGTTISAGAVVSVTGNVLATPVSIAQGGTGAATKAAAQTALGLGQDPVNSTSTGLAQAITAANVQAGAVDVTVPAAGTYLIEAGITVEYTGTTFVASRSITFKVRNITQGVDIVSHTIKTGVQGGATFPDADYQIPPVSYAGAVANDHLQIFVLIDVINSAGTLALLNAFLTITPLRKS